ncbi:hypothetical protein M8818_000715 [Zalaria obscura]|uniref:Uncharacterized protein n=1 Tax=Zalaria obscura TaxID=2024903 RepID=A0ACC3SM13_9PEZI
MRQFEREANSIDVLELFTGEQEILHLPAKEDYIDDDTTTGTDTIAHRIAKRLLNAWISEGIQIEIEDCSDIKEAYDLIKKRYHITDERARDTLLADLRKMTIDDYEDVTDYLNKLRRLKNDLHYVKAPLTDDIDNSYKRKEDKSHLKCGHCEKTGHIEEDCWSLHPDKLPRALKDKVNISTAGNSTKGNEKNNNHLDRISALATIDVSKFYQALTAARSLCTHTPSPYSENLADFPSQALKPIGRIKDGVSAFMIEDFDYRYRWLADSGSNMHIANNKKWFTDFYTLQTTIGIADKSISLQILGGGIAEIPLQSPNGDLIILSLLDVAYALEGRCNLLLLGMLA